MCHLLAAAQTRAHFLFLPFISTGVRSRNRIFYFNLGMEPLCAQDLSHPAPILSSYSTHPTLISFSHISPTVGALPHESSPVRLQPKRALVPLPYPMPPAPFADSAPFLSQVALSDPHMVHHDFSGASGLSFFKGSRESGPSHLPSSQTQNAEAAAISSPVFLGSPPSFIDVDTSLNIPPPTISSEYNVGSMSSSPRDIRTAPFISKLRAILADPLQRDAIRWNEDGRVVLIVKAKLCEDILGSFFKSDKYKSFVRQMNLHGFRQCPKFSNSPFQGFECPLFVRDDVAESLQGRIRRKMTYSEAVEKRERIDMGLSDEYSDVDDFLEDISDAEKIRLLAAPHERAISNSHDEARKVHVEYGSNKRCQTDVFALDDHGQRFKQPENDLRMVSKVEDEEHFSYCFDSTATERGMGCKDNKRSRSHCCTSTSPELLEKMKDKEYGAGASEKKKKAKFSSQTESGLNFSPVDDTESGFGSSCSARSSFSSDFQDDAREVEQADLPFLNSSINTAPINPSDPLFPSSSLLNGTPKKINEVNIHHDQLQQKRKASTLASHESEEKSLSGDTNKVQGVTNLTAIQGSAVHTEFDCKIPLGQMNLSECMLALFTNQSFSTVLQGILDHPTMLSFAKVSAVLYIRVSK